MKLRKRWILVAVVSALIAVPAILLTSETALRYVVSEIESRVDGLQVSGIRGRLLTGVSATRVRWTDSEGTELTIEGLSADWNAFAALTGRVHIGTLRAETIALALTTTARPEDVSVDTTGFDLPALITARVIDIGSFTLDVDGTRILELSAIDGRRLLAESRTLGARDLTMAWRVHLEDRPGHSGTLSVRGTSDRGFSIAAATGDRGIVLDGMLASILSTPVFTGTATVQGYDLQGTKLTGEFRLAGWLERLEVSGHAHLTHDGLPPIRVDLDALWGKSLFTARQLSVITDDGLHIRASGRYDWSATLPSARLRAQWEGAQWPLASDAPMLRSSDGRVDVTLDGFNLHADLRGHIGENPDGMVIAEASLPWPMEMDGMRGRIELSWTDLLFGEVDSPVGKARASGALDDWAIALDETQGRFRDQAFTVTGTATGAGQEVNRLDLSAEVGEANAQLRGAIGESVDLEWRVLIPDLAALLPEASGQMRAQGSVLGSPETPLVRFELEGRDLAVGEQRIARTQGAGTVDLGTGGQSDARLTIQEFSAGAFTASSAEFRVGGPPENLTLELELSAEQFSTRMTVQGSWRDRSIQGRLTEALITMTGYEPWSLQDRAAVELGPAAASIARSCWAQEGGAHRVCTAASWGESEGIHVDAQLQDLPLPALAAWLPLGFTYEGTITGEARMVWATGETPEVQGQLSIDKGAWKHTVLDEVVPLINWNSVHLEAQLTNGDLDGSFRFALADGGELVAAVKVPILDTGEGAANSRALRAELSGQFSDFDLVPALVPDIGTMTGQVRVDLNVDGSLDNPRFRGDLEVADGVMTLPRLGLRLTEMEFELDGGRDVLAVRAQTRSGDGLLSVTGLFVIRDGRLLGDVLLDGEDFQASNIPEARVNISPRIGILIEGHTVRVDGDLRVPFARLEPRDVSAVVQRSSDEVLVDGGDGDGDENPWRIHTRIRLGLGDVRFQGFGLTGRITGNMTVVDEPGLATSATGELQVQDGRYAAWGQQLEIERGRLIFSGGPINRPGLDIRAVRRPRDVMVGVNVRGTLQDPELRLISEPAMQQAELLSWLVLGMPLAQTTGAEQQQLDRTARTAGLAGGELLARELGRRLGVSEVGIEHGVSPDDAALVIGHYFSPRVYVAYGIGLYEAENSLRLRFLLSRMWSIEVQTSERATSTDIKYTIER